MSMLNRLGLAFLILGCTAAVISLLCDEQIGLNVEIVGLLIMIPVGFILLILRWDW